MRNSTFALASVALLALAGCGSGKEPVVVETEQGLDDAVNVVTDIKPDPMAPATGAPMPEATSGGAAVQ